MRAFWYCISSPATWPSGARQRPAIMDAAMMPPMEIADSWAWYTPITTTEIDTSCCTAATKPTVDEEISLSLPPVCAMNSVARSQLRWIAPCAFSVLTASRPVSASTRVALRCDEAWNEAMVSASMRAWAASDTSRISTMATSGGSTIHGEIQTSASRNSRMKGRSTNVVMVAEAMKSRMDSNERRLAAKEPTDTGRPSMRRSSTRSMICADRRTSTLAGAVHHVRARGAQDHVEDDHQSDAQGQHPERLDGVVGHHAVIDVHGEQRHRHGEDVDQQRGDQRVAVQPPVFHDGGPEPMALAHLGYFGRAGVEAELRPHEAHQAGVLQRQFLGAHFHRAAAQFGMADQVLAAFLLEQQAGALALQQQDGGQQVLGISSSARLTTRADSCARAAARGSRPGSGGGLPAAGRRTRPGPWWRRHAAG